MKTFLLSAALGFLVLVQDVKSVAQEVSFNEHIRPILAEHCLQCHGPDEDNREGDLRLDVETDAKESAIIALKPDESELIQRVTSDDPDLVMPPRDSGKPLSENQIAQLRQWIAEGASYEGHWSLEPITMPEIPQPDSAARTEIDRFIVAALDSQDLSLSPPVNRQQLIRRATFDLIGLPPTWEEVEAFVADTSPQAFEKVIDRLLSSPRYGERWGRHWLDLARYADTHGGGAIGFTKFPFSYTYRDYVIKAFNKDLPYDRFVKEQLAADQLDLEENDPALAGLGFLTIGMQFRNRHDLLDDQIDVVSRGLMGLTVACARCHDHKYDPIPTADYYSLYATLATSHKPDLLPVVGQPADSKPLREYQANLQKRQVIHEDMARDQTALMRSRLRLQIGLYLTELAKGTPKQDPSAVFQSYRTDDIRPLVLNRWRDYLAEMPADDPVFGPWVQLAKLKPEEFSKKFDKLIKSWQEANGDPAKFSAVEKLTVAAPKWNPRVLAALEEQQPSSMLDIAKAYGNLFAEVHREWSKSVLAASLEAMEGAQVVPDEDKSHAEINSAINCQLRRHLYHPDTPTAMPDRMSSRLLNRTIRDNLNQKRNTIEELHLNSPGSPPRAMALQEQITGEQFHVLLRGNPINPGEAVEARFLSALATLDAEPFAEGSKRLELAESIVDPRNPLSRRVIVNWVWQHHFGKALVRTPDDFGTRGQPPTHPELLDYLAIKLLEDDWSLKKLHRRIMLTETYQQAAIEDVEARIKDSDNRLLWRMPRRRLELEAMRDAMLAVSDELDVSQIGGRPFTLLANPTVPRRSLYGFINRDIVSSLASTFDQANPNSCTAKRPETNVPQQTLFALNSEFIQDRAVALAKLTATETDSQARIQSMYRRILSRLPLPEEMQISMQYLDSASQNGEGEEKAIDPWQQLAHVLLAANEFVFVD